MRQYSTFIFSGYSWNPSSGTIELRYSLDDEVRFTETLALPSLPRTDAPQVELDAALFALHLIGGISYFKTCLPKRMKIMSGTLTKDQAEFWNSVYENGLSEFFFRNDIDFRGLINFPSKPPPPAPSVQRVAVEGPAIGHEGPSCPERGVGVLMRTLVPLGGGKDSVVTVERLRKTDADITLFRMGAHPLIEKIAQVAGLPLLTVKRSLSPELFRLNEEGAMNGHIPITAYLSCVTIVVALLYGFDAVVMSNERSADFGNTEFKGKKINHQWSKSAEFEMMFRDYISEFVTGRIGYWSALRQMTELEIVGEFVKYPQYLGCTTSCNENWKILKQDSPLPQAGEGSGVRAWCRRCPKCAFVFALYAAFLPKKTLIEIFGRNLFDDAALIPLYMELLGLAGFKPFECVGTPEETREAFATINKRGELNDTAVMQMHRAL